MRRGILILALALGLATVAAPPAHAGMVLPGTYQLLDHGFGALGPDYGLRVDAIGEVFSFELGGVAVFLTWDGGATANISGTIHENDDSEIWTLNYDLTGVTAVGTLGFTATGGSGTITDSFLNVTNITGEANPGGDVMEFFGDGHRIPGDNDTPVGRGWLLPPSSTDDFLFRAVAVVPEPAALLLLGLGGLALAASRRR